MRIISGIYKNREFSTPEDSKTHPMGNREKLALFNMILSFLPSSVVLDAFSGSGALGLESLSRGASKVFFVDNSLKSVKVIKKNLEIFGISAENYEVLRKDVKNLDFSRELFDIIFADPPYGNFKKEEIEALVKFLKPAGILVLSSPENLEAPVFSNLELLKSKTYAAARISLFKKI